MEKLIVTITIPENLDLEDELTNLLNDDRLLAELENMITYAVASFVTDVLDLERREVEIKVERRY